MKVEVPSASSGAKYTVDTVKKTCTCVGFRYNRKCRHVELYGGQQEQTQMPLIAQEEHKAPAEPKPIPVSQEQKNKILELDRYLRTRVGRNHILRDFMFSTRADVLGISNMPSDDRKLVVQSAQALCEKVIDPLMDRFGSLSITYGYQSRKLIEAGYPPAKKTSSAPHQWDRGTFGEDIYARVDVLIFGVEDGLVTKHEVGRWMMANLDIDLLMLWRHSNVMCITISPAPRRVFLEWVPYGEGEGGTNRITYMGEQYWQEVWPHLPEDRRPRFGPSFTGGRMFKKD